MFFLVTPTGFEPISSEPESDILSIELRSRPDNKPCGELRVQIYVFSFISLSSFVKNVGSGRKKPDMLNRLHRLCGKILRRGSEYFGEDAERIDVVNGVRMESVEIGQVL